MAKLNLGRVRYPIESTVNPASCWPVSSAAVAKYVDGIADTILEQLERGGRVTYRSGWFIRYIDDSSWNYADGTGTVNIYVCDEQQRLSTLTDSSASVATVYDPNFDTGWSNYASGAGEFGDLVVVKNLTCFAEAGIIKSVSGNRITVEGIGRKFLNGALAANNVDHLKVFFTADYQSIEATGKAPGVEHPEYADEWSIAIVRPYASVAGETSIHNIGDKLVSLGGYAIGDDTAAFGDYSFASGISSLALAVGSQSLGVGVYNPINGATIVGTWNKLPDPGDEYTFAVGVGTGENDRKDGFRVNKNGSVYIKSIADLPAPTRSDTLATLATKMRNLAAALCRNPDGSAANGSASGEGDADSETQPMTFDPEIRYNSAEKINAIATGSTLDGRTVVVAATTCGLYYSDDGVSFTRSCDTGIWHGVVFDAMHKTFVAVSSTGIKKSSDGIVWDPSRVKTSVGGEYVDSNSAEGDIRYEHANASVCVGSRISTDGGVTFSYSSYQDLAACYLGYTRPGGGVLQHYAAIRGGKLYKTDGNNLDTWTECSSAGSGFVCIDSCVCGVGGHSQQRCIAITADGKLYEIAGSTDPEKVLDAPADNYVGCKLLPDEQVALFTESNGVIMTTIGLVPWEGYEMSRCPTAMSGRFAPPYAPIEIDDDSMSIMTQLGQEDCLLVRSNNGNRSTVVYPVWTRASGFSANCYPPILYGTVTTGELLAITYSRKQVLRIPMADINDALTEACEKSLEVVPEGRFVDRLDGDIDGLSSLIESFNKLAGKVNMIIDRAAL